MLHIERMQIRLPEGYEHRASAISHLVAQALSQIETVENRSIERLSLSPITIADNVSDQEIANDIAKNIELTIANSIHGDLS